MEEMPAKRNTEENIKKIGIPRETLTRTLEIEVD